MRNGYLVAADVINPKGLLGISAPAAVSDFEVQMEAGPYQYQTGERS